MSIITVPTYKKGTGVCFQRLIQATMGKKGKSILNFQRIMK